MRINKYKLFCISENRNVYLLLVLVAILISRFISMVFVPFTDTTEARYGEIARLMMETGDWITPYFNYDIPFWGKPPFAFWAQAMSFNILGVNEFAARFPSWLATVITTGLLYRLVSSLFSQYTAILTATIFVTCLLAFVLSGAVLIDPFLTLAVTLSLSSFMLIQHEGHRMWGYLFFVGLAIGLLSKGPVALVLVAGPISIWLLGAKIRWHALVLLPWLRGLILMAALSFPWYIAAEIRTPGFIEYFIVGEHFYRFIDPGWQGDLYGSAHKHPKGTIWIFWLAASFPWGLIALGAILKNLFSKESRKMMQECLVDDDVSFFILWAVFPMCFFSLAGNVLWTYILPALPPLAILVARYFSRVSGKSESSILSLVPLYALIIPVTLLIVTAYTVWNPDILPTEKYLISHFNSVTTKKDTLLFVDDRSFSARFYSREKAELLKFDVLKARLQADPAEQFYLAMRKNHSEAVRDQLPQPLTLLFESNKYALYETQPDVAGQPSISGSDPPHQ